MGRTFGEPNEIKNKYRPGKSRTNTHPGNTTASCGEQAVTRGKYVVIATYVIIFIVFVSVGAQLE